MEQFRFINTSSHIFLGVGAPLISSTVNAFVIDQCKISLTWLLKWETRFPVGLLPTGVQNWRLKSKFDVSLLGEGVIQKSHWSTVNSCCLPYSTDPIHCNAGRDGSGSLLKDE